MKNIEKFNQLMENEEFVKEFLGQESKADVQIFLAKNDIEMSIDEIDDFGKALDAALKKSQNGELSDADLEEVAGGFFITGITAVGVAKCVIAVGSAGLAIYKWYKSTR